MLGFVVPEVQALTEEQKNDILSDLYTCLKADRLRDAVYSWTVTKKGNLKSSDKYTAPHAPHWFSLTPWGFHG